MRPRFICTLIPLFLLSEIQFASNDEVTKAIILGSTSRKADDSEKRKRNLTDVWRDIDPETAQSAIEDLLKERFTRRIDTNKIKSKCLIDDSIPIYFNNTSDFNLLVETNEPLEGNAVRTKRVVEAATRTTFFSKFKSSTFTISTQTKETRDKEYFNLRGNQEGMRYDTEVWTKEAAERNALIEITKLRSKRAFSGVVKFKFKAANFFKDIDECLELNGLEILAINDPNPTGQILVSVHRIKKWDDTDSESEDETQDERYFEDESYREGHTYCKYELSLGQKGRCIRLTTNTSNFLTDGSDHCGAILDWQKSEAKRVQVIGISGERCQWQERKFLNGFALLDRKQCLEINGLVAITPHSDDKADTQCGLVGRIRKINGSLIEVQALNGKLINIEAIRLVPIRPLQMNDPTDEKRRGKYKSLVLFCRGTSVLIACIQIGSLAYSLANEHSAAVKKAADTNKSALQEIKPNGNSAAEKGNNPTEKSDKTSTDNQEGGLYLKCGFLLRAIGDYFPIERGSSLWTTLPENFCEKPKKDEEE